MNSNFLSVPKEVNVEVDYGKNDEIIIKTNRNGIFLGEIFPLLVSAATMAIFITLLIFLRNQFIIAMIMFFPYIIVFLLQCIYMIDAIVEYQIITLFQNKIKIEKRRFVKNRSYLIENITGESFAFKKFGISIIPPFESFRYSYKTNLLTGDGFEIPIVYSNNNSYFFFENRSIIEQKWIMLVLKKFYEQKNVTYS